MKSAGNRDVVQSRLQVLHVHVFLVAPLGARHMAQPRADQHQGGVAVRERSHHAGSAADLTVQPLDRVVGADTRPMLAGEVTVGQRLFNAVLDLLGSLLQLHGAQLGDHSLCLLAGRLLTLLRVDRLEHFCHNFDLGFGHNRENVAVEMYRAALVFGIREHLTHGLQHSHALVADDELHAVQAASVEPLEEADPTGLVLFHALGGTQNLTKTVLIHGNCHQNCHIFVLSAPVAAQVDAVHVDVWIVAALQGAVAPVLDVNVGFLVQFADGSGRHLAAPQCLRDVLHPAHGDTRQVHLDEGLLHAALPAAISFDDGRLKGHALEPGHVERNVTGGGGEIPVVVAAAVALTGLAALIAGGLRQGLRLLLQQLVQGFLHAAADQFLDLPLDNFLIQLYNFLGHSLLSPFRMVCGNFILPEPASYVFFYALFNLRKLLYIIFSLNSGLCGYQFCLNKLFQ